MKKNVLFASALSLVWMGFLAVGSVIFAFTSAIASASMWDSFWSMLIYFGLIDFVFFCAGVLAFIVGVLLLRYLYHHGDKLDKSTDTPQ